MKDMFPIELLRPSILKIIKDHHPDLLKKKFIGVKDLDEAKKIYFLKVLESVEESPESRDEIVSSLMSNEFVVDNVNEKVKNETTLGDHIATLISNFLGSWFFIVSIILFIGGWIAINLFSISNHFDPYPFALLGFSLAIISSLQSPFILNSQKKQSERDRLKFDEDFQTNIKSELEIRNLHSKMDHYNKMIWEKLDEIQRNSKKCKGK